MKISELKRAAVTRLRRYGNRPYKLAFFTFAIAMAAQLLVDSMAFAVVSYQGGEGLSGMGSASFLQTMHELLSIAVQVLSPLWTLGFTAAIMAFMDWQDPADTVLLTGLRRWWEFLKLYLLEGILMFFVLLAVIMPISFLYALTPWAGGLMAIPEQGTVSDAEFFAAVFENAAPFLVILALALILVLAFISYRLRFTNYMILHGWIGVMSAMTTSFALTKGRVWTMLKLDLSYWWYYLASGALAGVYIAVPLLGYDLGFSYNTIFWLTYAVYALGSLALDVFALPRITAANVLIYRGAVGKD